MVRVRLAALAAAIWALPCQSFTPPTVSLSRLHSFGLKHSEYSNPSKSQLMMGIMEDFISGTDKETRRKKNEKYLDELNKRVQAINNLEPEIEDLGDDELLAKTEEFRKRLQEGEDINGNIVEEAFAVVREAAWCVRFLFSIILAFKLQLNLYYLS